jgi:hypothetical protein
MEEAPDDGSLRSARPNYTGRLISIIVCQSRSANFEAQVNLIKCVGGGAAPTGLAERGGPATAESDRRTADLASTIGASETVAGLGLTSS